FYFPTVQASLPAILDKDELLKANSFYLNISTLSRIGGTALGGARRLDEFANALRMLTHRLRRFGSSNRFSANSTGNIP
ncbi:hypothetical protein SB773_32135, partial [Bacillus sp. SIMBA_074]